MGQSCYRVRYLSPLLVASVFCVAISCGSARPNTGDVASQSRVGSPAPTPSCATASPSHRTGASAAFDAGRQVTVVFGGSGGGSSTLDETWLFDGNCWQHVNPAVSPAPRLLGAMAYDPMVRLTLLIGGRSQIPGQPDYPEDAWTWDGTAWARITGAPKLDFPLAAYDQARHVVIVFGFGPAGLAETWTWDGTTWLRKLSTQSPSVVSQSAMCFDRSTLKVLLYGGVSQIVSGGVSAATWLWDGNAWSQAKPAHDPGPRYDHVLSCGLQTILFGGLVDQTGGLGSGTWVWDGADWQQVAAAHAPPDCCGAAVYDGSRQLIFETAHDGMPTWSWSGSDWAQVA